MDGREMVREDTDAPGMSRAAEFCAHLLALAASETGGEAALLTRDARGVHVLAGQDSAIALEGADCLLHGQGLECDTHCLLPVRSGLVEVWLCVRRRTPGLAHILALCVPHVEDLLRERGASPALDGTELLERMELRMRRVAETADVAFYRYDFSTRMITGDVRFARIWDASPERLAVGVPLDELLVLVHPQDRELFHSGVEEEMQIDGSYEIRFRLRSRTPGLASTRHLLMRGWRETETESHSRRSVGLAMDVSVASSTAEALRSSEAFTQLLLTSLPDCIHILDCDGTIRFINEGGIKAMELDSPIMLHGRTWLDLWLGSPRLLAEDALQKARGGETARFQGYALTLKGHSRFWDVAVAPIFDEDGEVERLLAIGRDLTEANQAAERVQLALDAGAIAGTWVWDERSGCMQGDARLATTLGLDPAALAQGVPHVEIYDAVDPRDRFSVVQAFTSATRHGGRCRFEFRVPTADGPKWFEGSGFCDLEDDRRIARFPGIVLDIDRSKRQSLRQAALVELGDQLRPLSDTAVMEEIAAGILCRELEAGGAGYGIVNDSRTGMMVGEATSVVDRPLRGEVVFADYGGFGPALARGESVAITDVRTHPLTQCVRERYAAVGIAAIMQVPLFKFGRLVGVMFAWRALPHEWSEEEIVFMRAVADRTHASMRQARTQKQILDLNVTLEERIRQRTRERDRLWTIARDLFVIVDRDGRYLVASPSWETTTGYDPSDLSGMMLGSLAHPDDAPTARRAFARLREGEPWPAGGLDVRMRRRDGGWRVYNWVLTDEGDAIYGVGRDLTERNELEEQLRQSQKMEAVGQLTGGLAHDFNNLLAGIGGGLELMALRLAQGRMTGLERYISASQDAVRRAASLTHRLLAFSRRQTLDPTPTDVNVLVAGFETLLQGTVGPEITLVKDFQADLWLVRVDANQLENAVLNLSINARDSMEERGTTLHLISRNQVLGSQGARDMGVAPGQYVVLTVEDEGCGMTPDVAQRAFDPFFTTKPQGQGTGLGLSMIYGFVRQSGGQVVIHSTPGVGTRVSLWLPRYKGAELPRPDVRRVKDVAPPKILDGRNVLVVDDEESVRGIVAEVVVDMGGRALTACDGPSALALMQGHDQPALVVSDIGMPGGMNGRELAECLRERWPTLRVLLITGYAEQSVLGNEALPEGCTLLVKPFTVAALTCKIEELLRGGFVGAVPSFDTAL